MYLCGFCMNFAKWIISSASGMGYIHWTRKCLIICQHSQNQYLFFLKRPLETYMYFAFNVISLTCVNNRLSIYCGHLHHDNTHTKLQLQWNNFIQIMQSWMTLQISPSWASYGCLSWDLQRNMTVIYQECTVVPIDMGNLYSKTSPNIRSVTYNISHEIWSYFLCSVSSIYTMRSQWILWFLYP